MLKSIKLKSGLKPLKMNSIHNSNDGKNTAIHNYFQNSKSNQSKINIIIQNNENSNYNKEPQHHVEGGYERHYGKEENCPLCKNMKKKSQLLEEKIFGFERNKFIARPFGKKEDLKMTGDFKDKLMKKVIDNPKNEEEKNINNNANPHNTLQSKLKQSIFKDTQSKYSSKRNLSMKNFNNKNEPKKAGSIEDSNLGNIFDIQFPAINSYFHS